MLALALNKDDLKGEQRRRAQDCGKALAGKSTLNRLELTAQESDKPDEWVGQRLVAAVVRTVSIGRA